MGIVSSLGGTFKTASFYSLSQTVTNGVPGSKTWTTLLGSAPVKFWQGSVADTIVSEKYRLDLSGVIIVNPELVTWAKKNTDQVEIDGVRYSIINYEDIAGQGKVMQIPVKDYNG